MTYNPFTATPPIVGDSDTGLDQIVDVIAGERGLAGRITGADIAGGAEAANAMNRLIAEAAVATGVAADGIFTEDDVRAINAWIRDPAEPGRYERFVAYHGDDEGRVETGFHLVQNDGAVTPYRGENFVNTVVDGIYHIGFEIVDGRFLNEDGAANATELQVAEWLTQLWVDRSTTGSGLDRMTDLVTADRGLDMKITDAEIAGGADAANGINQLIADAIRAGGLDSDRAIDVADVEAINSWIRADAARYARFVELHGDDADGVETGFHLVQGDGASTVRFGRNFVNTVADGVYHVGFDIREGRFLNEDGKANATVADVASWIDYFHSDVSTSDTGLDWLVDSIKNDIGLATKTAAADINAGARAADGINSMIVAGIRELDLDQDGELSVEDVEALNAWFNASDERYARFEALHGDDADGVETGFHLVQNDGGSLKFGMDALIDRVADSIYHIGFQIVGENFVNEDGDQNATVAQVATWLNTFYLGKSVILDSNAGTQVKGTNGSDAIYGRGGSDSLFGADGDDRIDGGDDCDLVDGNAGADTVDGGDGDDELRGGQGDDQVAGGEGCDLIDGGLGNDSAAGGDGADTIRGSDGADVLDGGAGADSINGGGGDDSLIGGGEADRISGADGNDVLVAGLGADTLIGGGGADRHVFDTAVAADNADRITDYQAGIDKLVLAKAVFDALGDGEAIDPAAFFAGRQATSAAHHIVYDRTTGNVFYDVDGIGGSEQVLMATVNKGVLLTAADFLLI